MSLYLSLSFLCYVDTRVYLSFSLSLLLFFYGTYVRVRMQSPFDYREHPLCELLLFHRRVARTAPAKNIRGMCANDLLPRT